MHLKRPHESACLDVPDVYNELCVHGFWSDAAQTQNPCLPNSYTHLRHSISHFWPVKFSELILRTCDCVHGLYYRVSDALNVIDCELHPTEFSLIYSGGLVMYSSERSVQFSSKIYCDDRARDLYIFHCFIRHQVIFLCCVIVHMYLCTECVYWYETHSYCYLCIAKFIYSTECKPIYEASSCSWPIEFTYKCMRLSGCNAWKCHK